VAPFSHHQRPDWLFRARLKSAQLQSDAIALRETARASYEHVLSIQAQTSKLAERIKDLSIARERYKAKNDPGAEQVTIQLADAVAEMEFLDSGLQAAKKRHATTGDEAAVATRLANEATKVMAAVSHAPSTFSGNGLTMTAATAFGA